VLLDTVTYRFSGHSPSDASSYRTTRGSGSLAAQDSIIGYREYLLENDHASEAELDASR
jgi:2-oxoisovalerate dehydrogenase E1 component